MYVGLPYFFLGLAVPPLPNFNSRIATDGLLDNLRQEGEKRHWVAKQKAGKINLLSNNELFFRHGVHAESERYQCKVWHENNPLSVLEEGEKLTVKLYSRQVDYWQF